MAHRCSFEGSFAVDVELTWVLQSTGPRMIYHLLGILVDCFKCFISAKTVAARWMWPCGQGPGSRRGGSQLITDFFFDNGSGWLMHSHSSLTPRSVQDWWIAQKVAQQIKKQSRGSAFTASCRCPWYKEPHCNSEHTCSLVTQHTHTHSHAHVRMLCIYWSVQKVKTNSETVNNGGVESHDFSFV